jgi:surface polysaccharide O-acyltransferase-like enzyme
MMILGVVLHSVITYDTFAHESEWPLKDVESSHESMSWLFEFIHIFRMPIFFIVAGFFTALLFYNKSPKLMLKNRKKRVFFPFIVFLILLWPINAVGFTYSKMMLSGNVNAFNDALNILGSPFAFIPPHTMHLWFLYYLFIFVLVSYVLALIIKKTPIVSSTIHTVFNSILKYPVFKIIVFSVCTFSALKLLNIPWVKTSASYVPNPKTFLFYFSFFIFGWILFKSKHLLNSFVENDLLFTLLGIILFSITYGYKEHLQINALMALNALTVWLFVFGIMGLFIRFASTYSPRMRYISNASYWVYLVHLCFIMFLPGMIAGLNAPGPVKAFIVCFLTTLCCFVSYHYLVRGTFIGKFLNGR